MYGQLETVDAVRTFMESHVFAVLDFMWLLKSLQRTMTCVEVPWLPAGNREACRFVNELVLGEESDQWRESWSSHFEIYLEGMSQAGASRSDIDRYVQLLRDGKGPVEALGYLGCSSGAKDFIHSSATYVLTGKPHEQAAVFAFGREELIPDMFAMLLKTVEKRPNELSILGEYLRRHIELDGDVHTPLAFDLVTTLCDGQEKRWEEAQNAALRSLEARLRLWSDISSRI